MSSIGLRISATGNKNDKLISNFQTFESDIKKNVRVTCRKNLNDYLLNSSLHGLRYVGDRTITRIERIFFAFMFFLVALLSIFFISEVYAKWSHSPIIVTLNSTSTSVKSVPFPAVTICNMNQVRKSAIENIPEDSEEYAAILTLCEEKSLLTNGTNKETAPWDVFRETIQKVTPSCEQMLLYCEFGGVEFNCTSRFRTTLTDDGFCCIFNGVPKKYFMKTKDLDEFDSNESFNDMSAMWTAEKGYSSEELKNSEDTYPRPGVGAGNELGLTLILKADVNEYFCSSTDSFGFKVLLHSPNDLAKVAYYGIAIPTNYESRIAVSPTLAIATPAVRNMAIDVRKCIFEEENFLSFYRTYSEMNCRSECVTKLLYKLCNCIMFYQPKAHSNISICGPANMGCVENVVANILVGNPSFRCEECISGCFQLNYESTFSMAKIYDRVPFLRQRRLNPKDVAILHVYHSQTNFRAHKKQELVGFTDFLSNMGGLLGLFMGFSLFSIVEVFYFSTIRPYCNYLRFSKQRRELMSKLSRKMNKLRQRPHSPFIIKAAPNLNLDYNYHQRYLD